MSIHPTGVVTPPPTTLTPSGTTGHAFFITLKGSIYESETGWYTAYSTTGARFDDRQSAIDHGDERYRSDDFNVCTVRDGEVIAIGYGHDDFAPGFEDLTAITAQLAEEIR